MRSGILTFVTTGIAAVLTLMTSAILARYLGPEGRGLLLTTIVWPTLLFGVAFCSLNEAAMYQIGRARGRSAEYSRNLVGTVLTAHLAAAAVLPLVVVTLLPFALGQSQLNAVPLLLPFAIAFILLMALDLCFNAIVLGRGNARYFNVLRLVQPVGYAGGLLALVLLDKVSVNAVLLVTLCASAGSIILGFAVAGFPLPRLSLAMFQRLFRASRRIHPANMLVYVAAEADKLVVTRWMDHASAGIYAVALAVSLAGGQLVIQSFAILAYARISQIPSRKQQIALVCRFVQIAFLLLVAGNCFVALILPWIVPAVFGEQFSSAVPVALVLLVMVTARGIRQVLDRALRAILSTRQGMASEAAGLACFAVAAPIGASYGGLSGIAWGLAVSQLVALAVMLALASRSLSVSIGELLGFRWSAILDLTGAVRHEMAQTLQRGIR